MKILITGASGTLADSFITSEFFKNEDLLLIDKVKRNREIYKLDVSEFRKSYDLIKMYSPDAIFHFAATTDVDLCETDKLTCINDNYVATKNMVDIAKELNIPLVFTSSASIYDGHTMEYKNESAIPNPQNYYGYTKLLSENYILSNLNRYIILRLGWLMGVPSVDNKFVGKIYKQILQGTPEMKGVKDQYGSLTFADTLVEDLYFLIKNEKYGIFNYVSDGCTTRFQIIKTIVNSLHLDNIISVRPVTLASFDLAAKRPQYELLCAEKMKKLNDKNIKSWEENLNDFTKKYFSPLIGSYT
jgi:dTDP-4-dehydrorhamnose reductase